MKTLLLGLAMSALTTGPSQAQTIKAAAPPPLIPFSGALTAPSGDPFVGLVSAIFSLYEESDGGVPLWVDIQMVQTDAAGGYLVLLGAATELPVDLFATSASLWLGVQPEGQAEQPRVRFLSVPYALKASDADTLGGRSLSEFVLHSGDYGDGEGGGSLPANAPTNGSGDDLAITSGDPNGWTDAGTVVRLDTTTDRVGIGTTTPSGVLDLGNATSGRALSWGGTAANYVNMFTAYSDSGLVLAAGIRGSTASDSYVSSYGSAMRRSAIRLNAFNNDGIQFFVDSASVVADGSPVTPTERMRIANSGNIGIGTTSPANDLHIQASVGATMKIENTSADGVELNLDADRTSENNFLARIIHEGTEFSRNTNAPVWYKGCADNTLATTEALA